MADLIERMKPFLLISLLFLLDITTIGQSTIGKVDSSKLNSLFQSSTITDLTTTTEKFETDKSSTIGNVWINAEFKGPLSTEVLYHRLELSLIVPVKLDDHDYWGQSLFVLEILSQNDRIIFKRLYDNNEKMIKLDFNKPYFDFFLKLYAHTYNTKLEIDYGKLKFYEDDAFGIACGIVGQLPGKCKEMMGLVNKKQLQELLNWVKNISPLTKAYGVLGIYILSKKGLRLNDEEKKLFELARKETIEINTCSGCLYGTKMPLNILLADKNLNDMYRSLKRKN